MLQNGPQLVKADLKKHSTAAAVCLHGYGRDCPLQNKLVSVPSSSESTHPKKSTAARIQHQQIHTFFFFMDFQTKSVNFELKICKQFQLPAHIGNIQGWRG